MSFVQCENYTGRKLPANLTIQVHMALVWRAACNYDNIANAVCLLCTSHHQPDEKDKENNSLTNLGLPTFHFRWELNWKQAMVKYWSQWFTEKKSKSLKVFIVLSALLNVWTLLTVRSPKVVESGLFSNWVDLWFWFLSSELEDLRNYCYQLYLLRL